MRKLLLVMSVLLLGSSALFAQIFGGDCHTIKNTTNCDLSFCAMIQRVCLPFPYGSGTTMVQDACTGTIAPGKSGTFCIPVAQSDENCVYEAVGYNIYNASGEQLGIYGADAAIFTEFLKGKLATYVFPMPFLTGDCKEFISFTHSGDDIVVSVDPDYVNPCGRFCFRNETGCDVKFCVRASGGYFEDPCTPEIDDVFLSQDKCLILLNGESNSGCIDFGINPATGCYWCPVDPIINICGTNTGNTPPPCFDLGLNGGYGMIYCGSSTPINVTLTLENGVYVLRK